MKSTAAEPLLAKASGGTGDAGEEAVEVGADESVIHTLDPEAACVTLGTTSRYGLADDEVAGRLASDGYNMVQPPKRMPLAVRFVLTMFIRQGQHLQPICPGDAGAGTRGVCVCLCLRVLATAVQRRSL
jgi:hypothetical protein